MTFLHIFEEGRGPHLRGHMNRWTIKTDAKQFGLDRYGVPKNLRYVEMCVWVRVGFLLALLIGGGGYF